MERRRASPPMAWPPSACLGTATPYPILAVGKRDVRRCWTFARDERLTGDADSPEAIIYDWSDWKDEHAWSQLATHNGILQASAGAN